MNIAASCSMLSCAVEYQGKFQPRRPQPFGAAGKWGTDPAQTLRDKVTKAVALLSALPVADPADRYSVRNLTVLWLQADKSELTRRAYYADLAGLARLVPAHRSGSTGSSPCRRGRLEGEHDGDRPGRALRRAASSSIAHKLATLSNWYHHQRDGCGPTPHNEREEMLAPRCVILVAMAETARQRARASLRVHVPELVNVAVLELGHGLDNTAFVVGDLVLRVTDARSVIREARLLKMIAPRVSIPVPAPRFVDENGGVLAYPLLPGRPLLGHRPPPGSAIRLGQFLRELHGIDPAVVASLIPSEDANPDEWLEGLDGPSDLIGLLHATVPPPAGQRVVAHADLGAEHVLELDGYITDGYITAVIDWSDAAVTDPALDFARLYRDFGPAFLAEALDAYGGLVDAARAMARVEFFARCAALEDLAYGRDSGRSEYTHAAERSISWLFRRSG